MGDLLAYAGSGICFIFINEVLRFPALTNFETDENWSEDTPFHLCWMSLRELLPVASSMPPLRASVIRLPLLLVFCSISAARRENRMSDSTLTAGSQAATDLEPTAQAEAFTNPEITTNPQSTTNPGVATDHEEPTDAEELAILEGLTDAEEATALEMDRLYMREHIAIFDMKRLLAEMTRAGVSHLKSEQQMREELSAASNEKSYSPEGYIRAELATLDTKRLRREMAWNGKSRYKSDPYMVKDLERAWNQLDIDPQKAKALQKARTRSGASTSVMKSCWS